MHGITFRLLLIFSTLSVFLCQQQQPLRQGLVGLSLNGNWKIKGDTPPLRIPNNALINIDSVANRTVFAIGEMQTVSGEVDGRFYYNDEHQSVSEWIETSHATDLYLQLYDTKYRNKKLVALDIDIHNLWDRTSNSWFGKTNSLANVYMGYQKLIVFYTAGTVNITKVNGQIMIDFKGDNSLSFTATLKHSEYSHRTFLVYLLLCAIQFILLWTYKPGENHETRSLQLRVSEWLLLHSVSFYVSCAVIFTLNIAITKYDTELIWFSLIGILNCGLALYMMRKFQPVFAKFTQDKMFFIGFVFFILYVVLSFIYFYNKTFWMLESIMLFLWQISYSMRRGGKGGIPKVLIAIIFLSRLPLFCRYLIENQILRQQPQPSVAVAILTAQMVQFGFIFLQQKWGGRFLIPKQIVPDYYNYYCTKSSDDVLMKEECTICLNQLRKQPDESNQIHQDLQASQTEIESSGRTQSQPASETQAQINEAITKIRYMQTPCRHNYHISCLTDWMLNKLTCPTCREQLPPLNDV